MILWHVISCLFLCVFSSWLVYLFIIVCFQCNGIFCINGKYVVILRAICDLISCYSYSSCFMLAYAKQINSMYFPLWTRSLSSLPSEPREGCLVVHRGIKRCCLMESVTEFMFSTYFPFMQKIKTVPSSERSEVSLLSDFNTTQSGFPLPGTRYNGAVTRTGVRFRGVSVTDVCQ